jgi:uncharacterized protein
MFRAVLDTNVVVSAHLSSEGAAAVVFELAVSRRFRCFSSEPLLRECWEVLRRGKLGLDLPETANSLRRFENSHTVVVPRKTLQICRDPGDNKVMECAIEARADFVVTGNARHFPARFQDVCVVTPRDFSDLLPVVTFGPLVQVMGRQ